MSESSARKNSIMRTLQEWSRQKSSDFMAVYGFGSFFAGQDNASSDIDLGILTNAPLPPVKRWQLQEELASLLGKNVDLVDLRTASLVMKMQVVSQGERLFCSHPYECDRFETYIYSAYCRFNEERRGILQDVLKRGQIYG